MHAHIPMHVHVQITEFKCLPHPGSSHPLLFPEQALCTVSFQEHFGSFSDVVKKQNKTKKPPSVIIMHHVYIFCLYILFGNYKNQIEETKRLRQTASFLWAEPAGAQKGGRPLECHWFFRLHREREAPALAYTGIPSGHHPGPHPGMLQAKNGRPGEEGACLV